MLVLENKFVNLNCEKWRMILIVQEGEKKARKCECAYSEVRQGNLTATGPLKTFRQIQFAPPRHVSSTQL